MIVRQYATTCGRYTYESFTGPRNEGDYECDPEGNPLPPKGMRKVGAPNLDDPVERYSPNPPKSYNVKPVGPKNTLVREGSDVNSRIYGLIIGFIIGVVTCLLFG